jgi:hypothetical protein
MGVKSNSKLRVKAVSTDGFLSNCAKCISVGVAILSQLMNVADRRADGQAGKRALVSHLPSIAFIVDSECSFLP